MRILFLLIIFIKISTNIPAQEFKKVFLGPNAFGYKQLLLKYDQNSYSDIDYKFYSAPPTELFQKPVYKPTRPESFFNYETDISSLINRVFLVKNVFELDSNVFNNIKYAFQLQDTLNKEIIYYLYDSQFEFDFPFYVKGFTYTTEYVKQELERKVDEYTNEIRITSPIERNTSISISKIIRNNMPMYYLRLSTVGPTLSYNGKGLMLIFNDGTKLIKPEEEIKVNAKSGEGWLYYAFFTLNQNELNLFSSKTIKKFRLYVYDNNYLGDSEKFMYYVKAIRLIK